jgi:hypothetical protein
MEHYYVRLCFIFHSCLPRAVNVQYFHSELDAAYSFAVPDILVRNQICCGLLSPRYLQHGD